MELIDFSSWLTESKEKNRFDLTVAGWANVTQDGSELFEPNWHSKNGTLRYFANSPEVDSLIMASKTTSIAADRIKSLRAVDMLIMREAFAVPLYHAANLFCYNSRYGNVDRDASGIFHVRDFTVK